MADENKQHFPNVSSNHETLWKEKYFTLLKHCRQIEQVMYYLENCIESFSLFPNDKIVCVKHTPENLERLIELLHSLRRRVSKPLCIYYTKDFVTRPTATQARYNIDPPFSYKMYNV